MYRKRNREKKNGRAKSWVEERFSFQARPFFSLRFPFASFTTDQAKEGLLLAHVHVVLEELFTQTQISSKKHETDREGNMSELHRWDFL